MHQSATTAELYYIQQDTGVLASSVRHLRDYETADVGDDHYLVRDGTNRYLSHGIAPDGIHYLWISTNGDPIVIPEDIDDACIACEALGDSGPGVIGVTRQEQGAHRILAAVVMLSARYGDNVRALGSLDWFAEVAREVLDAIDMDAGDPPNLDEM